MIQSVLESEMSARNIALLSLLGCGSTGGTKIQDGGAASTSRELVLEQAPGGAMFADPSLFPVLRLHIGVDGGPVSVEASIGNALFAAAEQPGGDWVAELYVGGMQGEHLVEVSADWPDGTSASAAADLLLGSEGMQITDFGLDGLAATPRIHTDGDALWVTWVDGSGDRRHLWAMEIDGAGRPLGEKTRLTPEGSDVVSGRVVLGGGVFGILYQSSGSSLRNWLCLVSTDGSQVLGPVQLDADGWSTTADGDISYDGQAFYAAFRSYTAETSSVFWLRAEPSTGSVLGPIAATSSGDGEPVGNFVLPSFLRLETIGGISMLTYTRELWDSPLGMHIPQVYATVLDAEGGLLQEGVLPVPFSMPFSFEAHVHQAHGDFVPLWTAVSLEDPELNPPHRIYGARAEPDGLTAPEDFSVELLVEAPMSRGEMVLVENLSGFGTLAWVDDRTRENLTDGGIDLRAASMDSSLGLGEEHLFGHARFLAMSSELNGVSAGQNAILTWADERRGGTVISPMTEVYLETVWPE
jgi:hypothetical protein